MQETHYFKTQPHLSDKFLLTNPVTKMNNSLYRPTTFAPTFSFIRSSLFLSHQTQIQNSIIYARKTQTPVICARRNKRRNGSQRSTRFMLQLITIMASKFILPHPLDLVIGEIGGGDGNGGGGVWFWKVFGGGGFDGWRRRKRKINRKLLIFGFLVICGLGLCLWFGKELESNVVCGVLGFGIIGAALIQWLEKIGAKDWVLGFCVGGVLMGLGLRRGRCKDGWKGSELVLQ